MKRVLFLQHGLGYGGATKSLVMMQQALKDKVEIHTFVKKNKKLNKIIGKQLQHSKTLVELDLPGIYSYSEGTISLKEFEKNKVYFPQAIIDYIKKNNIDILHINASVFSNILKPIHENTDCKIVVHFREMLPFGETHPVDKFIITHTLKYANKIIAISPNEVAFFGASEKIMVMPNPHDFTITDQLLENSNRRENKIVVGMCANFLPVKGHLVFIEAIALVNAQFKEQAIEFRIIGYPRKENSIYGLIKSLMRGRYKKKVDWLVQKLNIKNLRMVAFTFDVLPEIAALDIYVRPDLSGNPWGRDIIEAMALKKPVIATGSSDFFVRDSENGFLVPVGDVSALASKIITLIKDGDLKKQMGERGYNTIKEKCDIETYGSKLMQLYTAIA